METKGVNLLETQRNAVHGFTAWLTSRPADQTDDHQFSDQLVQFLGFYRQELQRQIDGTPATQEWFDVIAVQSILGPLLMDVLIEGHPELASYQPTNEPATVNEMALRLIHDAVVIFKASEAEMGTYLKQPVAPGVLDGLIERVLNTEEQDEI